MRPVGGFGIRGWRVHCDCSYLSLVVYTDKRRAIMLREAHRVECQEAQRRAYRAT